MAFPPTRDFGAFAPLIQPSKRQVHCTARCVGKTSELKGCFYPEVMYPGVLAVSMRKYVYAVLLLAHTVPLPPTSNVVHEQKH